MAEALKHMYNPQFFETLCPILKDTIDDFNCKEFIFRVFNNEWPELELKQRVRHIAIVLNQFLPQPFPAAASKLVQLAHRLSASGFKAQSFTVIFIPEYIQIYGLEYPEV